MTEKGEEKGEEERDRESVLSFGMRIYGGRGGGVKKDKIIYIFGVDLTLEKERFQFQTSHGMNGKTGVSGGEREKKKH